MPNLPELQKISQISPDQSVICITGENGLPEWLKLSKSEKEYALRQLQVNEEYVVINSYFKVTYIVRVKDNLPDFRQKEELRKTAYNLRKIIKSNNHSQLVIAPHMAFNGAAGAFTEGLLLSFYSFDKYKTVGDDREKTDYPSKLLLYEGPDDEDLKWLADLTYSVWLIRDLINEPVSHLNAPALAEEIKKAGEESGFSVEVLNRGRIEALKMGGLLAVNRGSVDPPVFCILEWKPEKALNEKPVVLVGKGIVYDTGGLNIKPGDYMENMKGDMAGAAAVTGAIRTIAKAGLPIHVVGLVPATDNRPGGNAYTQGEIITMYNKMTVEVGNTDAEGRLILADAISYASKYKPELIIDVAHLQARRQWLLEYRVLQLWAMPTGSISGCWRKAAMRCMREWLKCLSGKNTENLSNRILLMSGISEEGKQVQSPRENSWNDLRNILLFIWILPVPEC